MREMVQAELMKVRTRWLPYVLVIIALIGVLLQVWLGGYVTYVNAQYSEDQRTALQLMALPWSLPSLLESGQYWGSILIGVLTASFIATDFNWGTVRQSLIRGHTRGEYLVSKLLALLLLATVGLAVALTAGILSSVLATAAAGAPVTLHVAGGPSVPQLGAMILRAGYGVLPYALLAFAISVVTRSTAAGTTAVVLYVFIESAVLGIFGQLGGTWSDLRVLFLGHNVSAVLAANRIAGADSFPSLAFRPQPSPGDLPNAMTGALVVALYCLAFALISYRAFARRDIRATEGG
ncbi:MAG: ABC transporter permease subunit [Dehalococcoidia bacterium]|nr:ABC transporter permease subunit [Dehalococcoidia bacterium]